MRIFHVWITANVLDPQEMSPSGQPRACSSSAFPVATLRRRSGNRTNTARLPSGLYTAVPCSNSRLTVPSGRDCRSAIGFPKLRSQNGYQLCRWSGVGSGLGSENKQ